MESNSGYGMPPARDRRTGERRIAGIDGLRAVAIIGVIAFHTRPSLLQGGFVGVTMFLVITGFLATRTVIAAVDRTGSFGYGRYLLRRLRRIWPMTLAIIAITPPLAWLGAPGLLTKAIADTLPDALFAGNWTYILRKVPYFEAAGLPSPLTHLWFLGVIMQFYVVWPLLMLLLCKATRAAWLRSRQLQQIADAYGQDTASGASGSVVIFGVGTNGILDGAGEVQRLIDLTGGKPTYFITIRMPYRCRLVCSGLQDVLAAVRSKSDATGVAAWFTLHGGLPATREGGGSYARSTCV